MVALLTLFGAMFAMGSGGGYFMMPKSIDMMLPKFLNLDKKGVVYPVFMNPPLKLRSRYMVFEITNKNEVIKGGKPKLGIRGPIYFNTEVYRDNISFHNEGQSVQYDTHRKLYLDEEASEDLDVKFWMFNPIVVGVADQVNSMVISRVPFKTMVEPIVFNSVNLFLERFNEKAIMKRSPREFLEGTKIDILDFLTGLANQFGLASLVPPGPPDNVFGIVYVQNETADNSEIWTGVGPTQSRFAEVISWHGHKVLPYWKGKCNIIEGTNGELYKPFVKPNKPIKIFFGQTCRSLILEAITGQLVTLKSGLVAYEYTLSHKNFQAPPNNAANDCYCTDSTSLECQVDGLIRLGPCFFDSPVFFARPNMTGANRRIRSTIADEVVNGTKLPARQSFWLDPVSSTPLKLDLTFMAVLKVVPQNYMGDMDRLQPLTYAPMFADTEALEIPDHLAIPMKILQKMYMDHRPMCLIGVGVGSVMALLGIMMPKSKKKKSKSKQANKDLVSPAHPKGGHLPQGNPIIMTDDREYDYYDDGDGEGDDYSADGVSYIEIDRRSTHSGRSRQTMRSARSGRGSHRMAEDQYSNRGHPNDHFEAGRGQRADYFDGYRSKSARHPEDRLGEPRLVDNMRRSARLYPQDYNYNYNDDQLADDRPSQHRASARTISSRVASGSDSGTDHEPPHSSRPQKSHSPSPRRSSARRRASSGSE